MGPILWFYKSRLTICQLHEPSADLREFISNSTDVVSNLLPLSLPFHSPDLQKQSDTTSSQNLLHSTLLSAFNLWKARTTLHGHSHCSCPSPSFSQHLAQYLVRVLQDRKSRYGLLSSWGVKDHTQGRDLSNQDRADHDANRVVMCIHLHSTCLASPCIPWPS